MFLNLGLFCKVRPNTHLDQICQAAFPLSAPPEFLPETALFSLPFYLHLSQLRPHPHCGTSSPTSFWPWPSQPAVLVNRRIKLDWSPRLWGLFSFVSEGGLWSCFRVGLIPVPKTQRQKGRWPNCWMKSHLLLFVPYLASPSFTWWPHALAVEETVESLAVQCHIGTVGRLWGALSLCVI